jgi:hypothetical protein
VGCGGNIYTTVIEKYYKSGLFVSREWVYQTTIITDLIWSMVEHRECVTLNKNSKTK